MSRQRRLVASLAASALAWVSLTVVVAIPAAQADVRAPHDPATYYAGTEGLSGTALADKLHTIIDDHTTLTYAQVYDALPVTDADPADPGTRLIDFYSGASLLVSDRCGAGDCTGKWNREHTWPQSHGGIGTSGPGADLFHMRPELAEVNSSRGNLDFDNGGSATVPSCPVCFRDGDSFEPRAAVKGDVARGLFYMAVRYDGSDGPDLEMNDCTCNSGTDAPLHGKLSTLVQWSLADPPNDLERARNDLVDGTYQHNRNPFIDHPEWVCSIWSSELGPGSVCGAAGGNQAPATSPMTTSTPEDTVATVPLIGSDPDGDPLSWSVSQAAGHGAASVAGSSLTYTPAQDFHGTDVVGVTVSDGQGGSTSTTVTITVTPVNDVPTASARAVTTAEDTARSIALPASDVDGDALTRAIGTEPQHGTVSLDGSIATYSPAANHHGPDSFTFTASDASSTSAPATVSITVTPVDDAPVAAPVTATTPEDTAKTLTLAGSDADGDPLAYAIAGQPGHGAVISSGAQATYTPSADFHGTDSFTWTVSDGTTTTTGTATLTVTPVNDAPTVSSVSLRTTAGTPVSTTLPTSDSDGDPVAISAISAAAHGSVSYSGTTLTYTPSSAGTDTFVVTVSDGNGGTATTQVGVEVAKASATLGFTARGLKQGEPGVVKVKVRGVAGIAATGKVTLTVGSKKLTAKVAKGVATFRIAKLPAASQLKVKARYSGDHQYAAGSARHTFTVK